MKHFVAKKHMSLEQNNLSKGGYLNRLYAAQQIQFIHPSTENRKEKTSVGHQSCQRTPLDSTNKQPSRRWCAEVHLIALEKDCNPRSAKKISMAAIIARADNIRYWYRTLVRYQPINKYRIISVFNARTKSSPFNSSASALYKQLTTVADDYSPIEAYQLLQLF